MPMDVSTIEYLPFEERLHACFDNMLVYKSPEHNKFFSDQRMPSFIRDWLLMRFSDEEGRIHEDKIAEYVKKTIPKKEQWNNLLVDMLYRNQAVRFLTKVKIDFDMKKKQALFSLPVFDVPTHKGDAVVDWELLEKHRDELLSASEAWGIVTVRCEPDEKKKDNILKLIDFKPFCPYKIDLDYYISVRDFFTVEEWIDILLGAVDYNAEGYSSQKEKLTVLKRLIPFVEKRTNLIELAPKETGKSYLFSQVSQYGWLVSGGSISRAKMFYDIGKRVSGLASRYDYVALDEIQSIKFTDPMEMQGALKGYLESGEYRIGDYHGVGEAGMVLLGNIDAERMDTQADMFSQLPGFFRESALLDRFHGFITGWDIPKMRESLKVNGWALNTEYFVEILHTLREESVYRTVVDRLLCLPPDAATRDTEAVKRLCTAFLKLLFPNATDVSKVNLDEFQEYCLEPAVAMRSIIKKQLGIIDPGEFGGKKIPEITLNIPGDTPNGDNAGMR